MFRFLCAFFLLSTVLGFGREDITRDKWWHFGLSGLAGAGAETFFFYKTDLSPASRVAMGTFVGVLPGLGKEFLDAQEKGNHFSKADLAFDIAGSFVGALGSHFLQKSVRFHVNEEGAAVSWTTEY